MSNQELVDMRSYRTLDASDGEEQVELAPHEDEIDFWDKVMRSVRQPIQRRMKAAELRAQYRHPKLAAVASASLNGQDFATLLERAIRASGKEREVKLIEGRAIDLTSEKGAG